MSQDALKVEWTDDAFYLVLGENEIELTIDEGRSLFVVLGRALVELGDYDEEPEIFTG